MFHVPILACRAAGRAAGVVRSGTLGLVPSGVVTRDEPVGAAGLVCFERLDIDTTMITMIITAIPPALMRALPRAMPDPFWTIVPGRT
jgi:hypothetical protein